MFARSSYSLGYEIYEGSMINQAREYFCDSMLSKDYTHLLFIDDDMGFREQCLDLLVSRNRDIVGCNYRMKVPPCNFTVRSLDRSHWIETNEESTGIEPVTSMGFGFCLISRRVIEAVSKPRFLGNYDAAMNLYGTEDTPFFEKAAEAGYTAYVDHDASKLVYHVGTWFYSYDDKFREEQKVPFAERIT